MTWMGSSSFTNFMFFEWRPIEQLCTLCHCGAKYPSNPSCRVIRCRSLFRFCASPSTLRSLHHCMAAAGCHCHVLGFSRACIVSATSAPFIGSAVVLVVPPSLVLMRDRGFALSLISMLLHCISLDQRFGAADASS